MCFSVFCDLVDHVLTAVGHFSAAIDNTNSSLKNLYTCTSFL